MREYAKKPESQSRTLDRNPKASRQAPIDVILQRYKERNIQRFAEDEELIQSKFDTAQREEFDEEELLQGKFEASTAQREEIPPLGAGGANNTGIPDNLKSGIENLSGYSMDDVRVHYNSSKPAQLQAFAYAQGTDIHVAPGQEQHLPHEAWHVVQQMQGRVQPTTQLQGINVNDNEGLEKEADVMGGRSIEHLTVDNSNTQKKTNSKLNSNVLQGRFFVGIGGANLLRRDEDRNKIQRLVLTLRNMHTNPINEGNITINIIDSGFLETNPANITVTNNDGLPDYNIDLEYFYLKMSNLGELVGMISHELGVHALADIQMGLNPEGINNPLGANVIGNADHPLGNVAILQPGLFNINISGTGYQMHTNRARQLDHVNAVDFSQTGFTARAQNYLNTFLEMGDAMGATPQEYSDLVKTFVFDVARILVTNDGPMARVMLSPQITANAMNDFFTNVVAPQAGNHPWINNYIGPQSGAGVFSYFLGKAVHGFVRNIV